MKSTYIQSAAVRREVSSAKVTVNEKQADLKFVTFLCIAGVVVAAVVIAALTFGVDKY